MSLQKFHILFITLATLCFVGFGLWCFSGGIGASQGGLLLPVAGGVSILLGLATAFYGMWFYRNKIRGIETPQTP